MAIDNVKDIYHRVRESHIIPGPYRLQKLLGERYLCALSYAPAILVGGTNGKGTTCAFLESICRQSKLKTGLYTSPHLVNANERIRIDGIPVHEKELLDTIQKLDTNRKSYLPDATFFELMTAAAFILFYEKKVDIIICEVGLGGRFDSTNALAPVLSVLTDVSLDHTHILGRQVYKIAQDKSYISRRNKFFVVSHRMSKRAIEGAKHTGSIIGSKIILTSEKLSETLEQLWKEFSSNRYAINIRTVLSVIDRIKDILEISNNPKNVFQINAINIRKGIQSAFWPGRFDIRQINNRVIIFDCAHNPGGIKFFLEQYAKSKFSQKKFDLIFASLNDKDWKTNLTLLAPHANQIEITEIKNERAQNAYEIFEYLKTRFPQTKGNFSEQIDISIDRVCHKVSNNPVVIIGSIAFVGAVFERLNLNVFPA